MNAVTQEVTGTADQALTSAWWSTLQRVGGVLFAAASPRDAAARIVDAAVLPGRTRGEHLHLANAYSVALASTDPDVANVFAAHQGWLLPDGKPVAWVSAIRRDGARLQQVRGPQLMLDVADLGRAAGLRHYLLGSSPDVLERLQLNLEARFPGIEIVGASSPPFRPPTLQELDARNAAIADSGAQVVWVGLGTPKQDFEAARLAAALPIVTVAVGAAFDYAAGTLRSAPHWVSAIGMEWAWRFAAEPKRLWRRYTVGNARFLRAVHTAEVQRLRDEHARRRALRRTATVVVGQLPPPLHGSAVMTQRLIEALGTIGRTAVVVDRRFSRSIADVGAVGLRKLLAIPSLVGRFVAATAGSGPVVLLITTRPTTFLLDALLLALARRPATLYVHTVGFRALAERNAIWRALVRRVLGGAEQVVVLGSTLVDDVAPYTEPGQISVIPNCSTSIEPYEHADGARLLFLSNLMPGKGADVFVRLATRLRQERPDVDWAFDVAGAGDPASLPTLPDGAVVHGRVEGQRKDELLKGADLLVMPSTYAMEAQPLVIVEAMSYGLPVVAYDTGGIRDLVDASTGSLVPAGDEEQLLRSVLALLDDHEALRTKRRIAERRHRERHSLTAYADAWRSVLSPEMRTSTRPAQDVPAAAPAVAAMAAAVILQAAAMDPAGSPTAVASAGPAAVLGAAAAEEPAESRQRSRR